MRLIQFQTEVARSWYYPREIAGVQAYDDKAVVIFHDRSRSMVDVDTATVVLLTMELER